MADVPILCICGKKNTGKTTLIEKLLPALGRRGLRLATVKHDRHGFEMDHEGKDTWRHKRAGAVATLISSPDKIGLVRDEPVERTLPELAALVGAGVDLVLAEGYKRSDQPKVELVRAARSTEAICEPGVDDLVALATDVEGLDLGVPRFHLDDVEALADHVVAWLAERVPVTRSLSGAVLAGGASRRMGRDKACLEVGGITLLERALATLAPWCDEQILVVRDPAAYAGLVGPHTRLESDRFSQGGALAGLHAAVDAATHDACLVLAVDMPQVRREVLELLVSRAAEGDAVVPIVGARFEPLCAVYRKTCLPAMVRQLTLATDFTILRFYDEVRLVTVSEDELRSVDPELGSFHNVNRPEDLETLEL